MCDALSQCCRKLGGRVPPELGQAMLMSRINLRNSSLTGNLTQYMFENLGVGVMTQPCSQPG
jgi:hypothetical protein